MKAFEYVSVQSADEAVSQLNGGDDGSKVIAGGMDLVTELKDHLVETDRLVDISEIDDLHYVRFEDNKTRIGANATISEIAHHEQLRERHTALTDAAGKVGSVQIRNLGTLGGNLCQRPRCWYYRDENYPCLKKGGAMCYALTGRNKYNAILGGGPSYIVHPSDTAPALVALNATVHILGPNGSRSMSMGDFFTLPTERLTQENRLEPNEIITEIEIPNHSYKSLFLKFKEKESYDWAISSAAVALELDGNNCTDARIVLGGVAPKPWRAESAEDVLKGNTINESLAEQAGEASVEGAQPLGDNEYKVPLTRNLVKDAIMRLIA